MSSYLGFIHRLRPFLGDLVVSATGSFSLMRCFRLVALGQERLDSRSPMPANGRSTKPFEGIGAALFLLVFVASEAAAAVVALRH